MTFLLVGNKAKCNSCVYWTGMRKKAEEIMCVELNETEWGICLNPNAAHYQKPIIACDGCSRCKTGKSMLHDPRDT